MDVPYAYHEVNNVKCPFHRSRSNVNLFHSQIYTRALKMAVIVSMEESRLHLSIGHRLNIQLKIVVITSV